MKLFVFELELFLDSLDEVREMLSEVKKQEKEGCPCQSQGELEEENY